jgi:protein SCO1
MKVMAAALALLFGLATQASAGLSSAALEAVGVEPRPGAALPLSMQFRDESGRVRSLGDALGSGPGVVIFADYTCHSLCGPILAFAAAGLAQSGLTAGRDYRLMVIGLDPKDGLDAARNMKASRIAAAGPLADATTFLTGDEAAIHATTAALGYRYAYDPEHDQFAHAAAAFVVNAHGRLTRVLSGIGLSGSDLRLALVDAGEGRVGSFGDRLRLLCYGFDPVRGLYTEAITFWLEAGAIATLLCMAGGIFFMQRKMRGRTTA